jgi:hypothetical protein
MKHQARRSGGLHKQTLQKTTKQQKANAVPID